MNSTKKQRFKELIKYIEALDGYGKPKLNFQELYRLFPDFKFLPARNFGEYANFGKAYEQKIYDMTAINEDFEGYIKYREYGDADENMAYIELN